MLQNLDLELKQQIVEYANSLPYMYHTGKYVYQIEDKFSDTQWLIKTVNIKKPKWVIINPKKWEDNNTYYKRTEINKKFSVNDFFIKHNIKHIVIKNDEKDFTTLEFDNFQDSQFGEFSFKSFRMQFIDNLKSYDADYIIGFNYRYSIPPIFDCDGNFMYVDGEISNNNNIESVLDLIDFDKIVSQYKLYNKYACKYDSRNVFLRKHTWKLGEYVSFDTKGDFIHFIKTEIIEKALKIKI